MVSLASVTFKNSTAGGNANIFYKVAGNNARNMVTVLPNQTSTEIDGTLLSIDIDTWDKSGHHVTKNYDFTGYLPKGVWVKDESPYTLNTVIDVDGSTLLLNIKDNGNDDVVVWKKPVFKAFAAKGFAATMTKQEVFNQLKAGISYEQASGYSISTLKEILSDLQPVNYKWLTYSADRHSWSAEIKGNSWATNLDTIEPGIAYPTIVEELSQAIQAADQANLLVNSYTPEAVEGLILRVSEAISAAAKIPYLLQDLNRPRLAVEKAIQTSVNMRVTNKSQSNKTILVFQKDIKPLSVKNCFVGAWQVKNLAPGSNLDFVIPVEITVRAVDTLPSATISTNLLPAQYGQKFVIDDSSGALTLTQSGDAPDPTTISVSNKKGNERPYGVGVYKNERFVVGYSNVPPNTSASISIEPKVYLSFAFDFKKGDIFQAALVANSEYFYDLQGHPNIVVELTEDPNSHQIDFGSAQYPDSIPQFGPDL
ncbi:MAG: hypothetical protein V7K48_20545 [Nostoc sp.]|uniref:hypothetical protein n=1 Tax=Nostoc sp. TaxID=1180 RepID=UPI002FFC709C